MSYIKNNLKGISKPALKKMLRYEWPGNVNELKNAVKSAVALCRGASILIEDLPSNVLGTKITKKKGDDQISDLKEWIRSELLELKIIINRIIMVILSQKLKE